MSRLERRAAAATEYTLYGVMVALPLVGWSMLSAARYPILLFGSVHLPFILPHDALLYAILRRTHTVLAYFLFLTILAHFGAILFHTLIVRDGMLFRMVPWNVRPREVVRGSHSHVTNYHAVGCASIFGCNCTNPFGTGYCAVAGEKNTNY
jgi:cytochrome b561